MAARRRLATLAAHVGVTEEDDDGSPMGRGTYVRTIPPMGAIRIDHRRRRTRPPAVTLGHLTAAVGQELGLSDWFEVTQDRVDMFALVTGDPQWIHGREAAARGSPFGAPITHGNLTLCLAYLLASEATPSVAGAVAGLNYGLNRVRYPSPLPIGSRIRCRVRLSSAKAVPPIPGASEGVETAFAVTVEVDGGDKPACVAELLSRVYVA